MEMLLGYILPMTLQYVIALVMKGLMIYVVAYAARRGWDMAGRK